MRGWAIRNHFPAVETNFSLLLSIQSRSAVNLACCPERTESSDHKSIAWAHRSLLDNFLPSSSHVISGVGLPDATHFRNTDGPGCRVSSLNACRICGGSTTKKKISYIAIRPDYIYTYIKLYAQDKCLLKKAFPYEMSTYINSSATIVHTGPISECSLHCCSPLKL